jgi:phosphoribosylaminoimidazole carboxylase (NCAIR synthetase)
MSERYCSNFKNLLHDNQNINLITTCKTKKKQTLSPNVYSRNQSRSMRRVGHVARMRDWKGAYRVLVKRTDVKSPLGRTARIWTDNIEMALQDVGWGGV